MAASSLFVVTNSLRLRRFHGSRETSKIEPPLAQPQLEGRHA
jgi:hypothetical protein